MDVLETNVFAATLNGAGFFRRQHTVTIAFAIGVLLFFLPFAEIKCNSVSLARNTGIGIALGSDWKLSSYSISSAFFSQAVFKDSKSSPGHLSDGPNIFAIAAIAAGLTGLLFCFSTSKSRSLICLSAGILSAVMLIAMMIQIRSSMKSGMKENDAKEIPGLDMSSVITINFTAWFFISLTFFVVAAFLGFMQYKIEMEDAIKNSFDFEFQREEKQNNVIE